MAKILYVVKRSGNEFNDDKIKEYSSVFYNDTESEVHYYDRSFVTIFGANSVNLNKGSSWLLGCLYEDSNEWYIPNSGFPDGSYAILRQNETTFEIVADAAASRTIWYYFDNENFIASTSQRAIVSYLGDFDFNESVIPWVLSTGSLGPTLSWDKRIKCVPQNSSISLDKFNWDVSLSQNNTTLSYVNESFNKQDYQVRLQNKISVVLDNLNGLELEKWKIPLSGGYDCRAILCGINSNRISTITWGNKGIENHKLSDKEVAKRLCNELGVKNDFFDIDSDNLSMREILDKILDNGEGRIDHISGYMDGMKLWETLHKNGVGGLIRGDEAFGWVEVQTPQNVLESIGCLLCSDYSNIKTIVEDFGLKEQKLPASYCRKEGETLELWRDRLYRVYRLPVVLAALSDFKLNYVEQINPFLSSIILDEVKIQPDELRTNKKLFKDIVTNNSPDIPFAKYSSTKKHDNIFYDKDIITEIRTVLDSSYARNLLGSKFIDYILLGIKEPRKLNSIDKITLKDIVRSNIPVFLKRIYKKSFGKKIELDKNVLAFRVYTIVRINDKFSRS